MNIMNLGMYEVYRSFHILSDDGININFKNSFMKIFNFLNEVLT